VEVKKEYTDTEGFIPTSSNSKGSREITVGCQPQPCHHQGQTAGVCKTTLTSPPTITFTPITNFHRLSSATGENRDKWSTIMSVFHKCSICWSPVSLLCYSPITPNCVKAHWGKLIAQAYDSWIEIVPQQCRFPLSVLYLLVWVPREWNTLNQHRKTLLRGQFLSNQPQCNLSHYIPQSIRVLPYLLIKDSWVSSHTKPTGHTGWINVVSTSEMTWDQYRIDVCAQRETASVLSRIFAFNSRNGTILILWMDCTWVLMQTKWLLFSHCCLATQSLWGSNHLIFSHFQMSIRAQALME
jgi:hypothetical protein